MSSVIAAQTASADIAMGRHEERKPPSPPQPPPFQPRVRADAVQMIGMALLALLPIAGLLGAFGVREGEARASAGAFELHARYPERMRYDTSGRLELRVENNGGQPIRNVRLSLSHDYLAHFDEVSFTPQPRHLGGEEAEFQLDEVPPGQARRIVVALRAHDYGRHGLRVRSGAADTAALELAGATLVLP